MATMERVPPYAVEIVNYRLRADADAAEFAALSRRAGAEFTSAQPGFLGREIGRGEDGTWLVLVYWRSVADAENSIGNIETIPESVKAYMAAIDRDTLTRAIFEVL